MLSREGRKDSPLFALGGIPARVFNRQSEHHLYKTHPPKLVCELNFGCYEDCSGATESRMSLQPVLKDREEKTALSSHLKKLHPRHHFQVNL